MTQLTGGAGSHGTVGSLAVRDIAEIDPGLCDGCGQCLPNCAEGALKIIGGKAVLADNLCDGLGNCLAHCPKDALKIIRRESVPFDHEAAMAFMAAQDKVGDGPGCPASCPGAAPLPSGAANPIPIPMSGAGTGGGVGPKPFSGPPPQVGQPLANWPIQLALAPPKSPHWDNEILVWAADCVPAAAIDFRSTFVGQGRPLVLGCPKLDDKSLYEIKIGVILASSPKIKELWLPIMSVPCCQGLWRLAEAALRRSGRTDVALKGWVFSLDGSALQSEVPVGPQAQAAYSGRL